MLKGKTVLLAEDDSTMQIFVAGMLRQELNCDNIVLFKNGQQVLTALKTKYQSVPLHLILCDWEMPGATGDVILKFVREDAKLRRVPVIMTTSRSDEESLKKVIKMGVNDYLVKPFSINDLVERIGRLFQDDVVKKMIIDDKKDAPSVELLLNGTSVPYKGGLREVSSKHCLTRFPVFKQGLQGLSGDAKLSITLKGHKVNLKVLVEKVAPDTEGLEEEEYILVHLKITEIDDANREMLKKRVMVISGV
jgi:CheY-like chemotaxis protein